MVIEMEDSRCKLAAIKGHDPRCTSLVDGVVIEMEDLRQKSLVDSMAIEMDDTRCFQTTIEFDDLRCRNMPRMW
jgi:hypothetical protein